MRMRAAALCVVVGFLGCAPAELSLEERLAALPGSTLEVLETEAPFVEAFDLRLVQPLDHNEPAAGSFDQRILVEHRGFDRPVVLVTEGYNLGDNQVAELAEMLGANQIRVEHRYVGDSAPENMEWRYLNIAQASGDYHRIIGLLREIYPGPWVSTGWSKGGQTALIYRSHFPDDVVATVAYDAPLPLALEDPRIDAHFVEVGTAECRQKIERFQRMALERKTELLPLFSWYAKGKGSNSLFLSGSTPRLIAKRFRAQGPMMRRCSKSWSRLPTPGGSRTPASIRRRSTSSAPSSASTAMTNRGLQICWRQRTIHCVSTRPIGRPMITIRRPCTSSTIG